MDALLFAIDDRRCALPMHQVVEVVPAVHVDAVPGAPPVLEGVVNVRGVVLPVLSLRARMGHAPQSVRSSEYLIIAKTTRRNVLIRSDTVPEIFTLPPLAASGEEEVDRALAAVVPLPDGLALLLDVESFLASVDDPAFEAALVDAGVADA